MARNDITDFVETLVEMMKACNTDEFAMAQAELCKRQYKAFIEVGFTNDEALQLLIAALGKKSS